MGSKRCGRCGSGALIKNFTSLRCPVCGGYEQLPAETPETLWAEHRLGLLFRSGGWRFMDEIAAPGWFVEHVA